MEKKPLGLQTISGIAENAKEGAIITTDDQIYYLEGIKSWGANLIGKQIKAKGQVMKETYTSDDLKNEKGRWMQGSIGDKYTILSPEWQLVEN